MDFRDQMEKMEAHELFHSMKGKIGRGVYGGANIVHRPRHGKRIAAMLTAMLTAKPSLFVSASMLCVSWALGPRF